MPWRAILIYFDHQFVTVCNSTEWNVISNCIINSVQSPSLPVYHQIIWKLWCGKFLAYDMRHFRYLSRTTAKVHPVIAFISNKVVSKSLFVMQYIISFWKVKQGNWEINHNFDGLTRLMSRSMQIAKMNDIDKKGDCYSCSCILW